MSLKKNDVMVDCNHCRFVSSSDAQDFVITVPLQDLKTGGSKTAILHCVVSAQNHEIEFQAWKDETGSASSMPGDLQTRLSAALDFVAEKRICGNEKICPSEVVHIVQNQSSD